jgi:hypothetical protein
MVAFFAMKKAVPALPTRKPEADSDWHKTPYPDLIRFKPSRTYFGRVRVNGKLISRSLKTYVLGVAEFKLSDFLQERFCPSNPNIISPNQHADEAVRAPSWISSGRFVA